MTLFIVQFVLPVLLGYTLYVGIADRMSLRRPLDTADRPLWLLGLGTALSVAGVVSVTLNRVYGLNLADSGNLLQPAALSLALALSITLAATGFYRFHLTRAGASNVHESPGSRSMAGAVEEPIARPHSEAARWGDVAQRCERAAERLDGFVTVATADPEAVDEERLAAAPDAERTEAGDHVATPASDIEHGQVSTRERGRGQEQEQEREQALARRRERRRAREQERTLEREAARTRAQALEASLTQERSVRERTEEHLRITRKALFVLEREARDLERHEDDRAHMEALIEDGIRDKASAEARAERESYARLSSQTRIAEQTEDLLRVRRELRQNVEARTRALSAATRSLEHAKRSARARHRLQRELEQARATISNRQDTISSLIRALEKEKRRSREEIASQARQLLLHERQLKERRGLEEVARSVEGKLTSRLVKKVARARPLVGG